MGLPQGEQAESCGGCPQCGGAVAPASAGRLRGWRVVLAAMGVFLWPPAAALAGAMVIGTNEVGQFLGAVVGLLFCVAVALVGARLLNRLPKEC